MNQEVLTFWLSRIYTYKAPVSERQFLGYRLLEGGKLVIAEHSIERLKEKVRRITKRNQEVSLETVIAEMSGTLRG